MKKTICVIMTLLMLLFALSSCGKGEIIDDLSPTTEPTTEEPTTTLTAHVTFPEGFTVAEIALKLEENGVCSAADFLKAVNDSERITDFGFASSIKGIGNRAFVFEGYVFPDTYDFYRDEDAATALGRFLANTERKLGEECKARAAELGYSLDEIVTIASIVQEESTPAEMGRVSAVLHNRLKSKMQLQCDVSIAYIEKSVKPYIEGDKDRYSAYYNTYKCKALPQGPICNPGMAAINAALYPEDTDDLFFVTDKTDPSIFYYAKTYEKHLENCKTAGW